MRSRRNADEGVPPASAAALRPRSRRRALQRQDLARWPRGVDAVEVQQRGITSGQHERATIPLEVINVLKRASRRSATDVDPWRARGTTEPPGGADRSGSADVGRSAVRPDLPGHLQLPGDSARRSGVRWRNGDMKPVIGTRSLPNNWVVREGWLIDVGKSPARCVPFAGDLTDRVGITDRRGFKRNLCTAGRLRPRHAGEGRAYATLCAVVPLPMTGLETFSHSARGPGWATGVVGAVGAGFDGTDTWSLHATISSDSRMEYYIVDKGRSAVKASPWNTTFPNACRQRRGLRPQGTAEIRRFGATVL